MMNVSGGAPEAASGHSVPADGVLQLEIDVRARVLGFQVAACTTPMCWCPWPCLLYMTTVTSCWPTYVCCCFPLHEKEVAAAHRLFLLPDSLLAQVDEHWSYNELRKNVSDTTCTFRMYSVMRVAVYTSGTRRTSRNVFRVV